MTSDQLAAATVRNGSAGSLNTLGYAGQDLGSNITAELFEHLNIAPR